MKYLSLHFKGLFSSLVTSAMLLCAGTAWGADTAMPTSGSYSNGTTKYEFTNSAVSNNKIYVAQRSTVTIDAAYGWRPYTTAFVMEVDGARTITFTVKSNTTSSRSITGQAYAITAPFFNIYKNTTASTQTLEAYVQSVNAKAAGSRTSEEAAIAAVTSFAAITGSKDANKKLLIGESGAFSEATTHGSAVNHNCPTTKGATNSFSVSLTAAGKYLIYLTSSGGSIGLTNIAVVASTPSCTAPTSVGITGTTSYTEGQEILLTAAPTGGSGTASYQWYKGGTAAGNKLTGKTSATLSINPCSTSDAGNYYCEVSTGATCSTFSSVCVVSVAPACTAPTSVGITGTTSYTEGQEILLTAAPTGGSGTASYQWYKGGTAAGNKLTGKTSATLSINPCSTSDAGNYYCEVSTGATCSTFSSVCAVSVAAAPTGTMVYLKPGTNWRKDGARFAVHYFGTGGSGWVSMDLVDGCVPTYSAEIPNGAYNKCIFCRMDGGTTANNWANKWNQTGDLDIPTGDAVYYIVPDDQWDSGTTGWWQAKPLGVCVSGTWLRFKGETITLTATCAGATHFQWYKDENVELAGQTSSTLTITNCDISNAGQYYCKAWRISGEENAAYSSIYGVKVPYLEYQTRTGDGSTGGDNKLIPLIRANESAELATCSVYPGVAWGYEYAIFDGVERHGNNGTMDRSNCSGWNMDKLGTRCKWDTDKEGTYYFYVTFSTSSFTFYNVTMLYPLMSQRKDIPIYMEKTAEMVSHGWNNLYYRIGKGKYDNGDGRNYAKAYLMDLVPGTARYYETKTPEWSTDFWAWHIGNNCGSQGDGYAIYQTHSSTEYEITESINFSGDELADPNGWTISVNFTSGDGVGKDWLNDNCMFRGYSHVSGMVKHDATVSATTNGKIKVEYTHYDNTAQTSEANTNRTLSGLAHTCILTITGVPDCGYRVKNIKVNGNDFTSGDTHILDADATITAEFEQYNPITYHTNDGTINEVGYPTSYVLGVGATLPSDVTKTGTWDFDGWYDNAGCTGSPITAILTSDCGAKEFWAKWVPGKATPVFTWTYDATVKAGGIYPVSVSSTGDADVTLTILETITGVTGSFTAGNPATGEVTIDVYPSATTYTYQASCPATSTYKAKVETRTVTIERCETMYSIPFSATSYVAETSTPSDHPRYYCEVSGVGSLTKKLGSSSLGSFSSGTNDIFSYYINEKPFLIQTYMDNVVKIELYINCGTSGQVLSGVYKRASFSSSSSDYSTALPATITYYTGSSVSATMPYNTTGRIEMALSEPLEEGTFVYIVSPKNMNVYGAKLYRAEGDEETSVAFSSASIEKFAGDAPFTQAATQTTTPVKSGGTITYASTDETVATVDKNTGEVTILGEGRTRIVATLNAFGCFKKSTTEYILSVKPCTDPACSIAVTSGLAAKCSASSVTLTATAAAGATFQWYKDGVIIPGETGAALTTTDEGDYYAEARKVCLQKSNTIKVDNLDAPTAVALHEYYYVRAGRTTPDIPLFQLTNVNTSDPAAFSMNHEAPLGCSYELREDGIVYLVGTPDPSIAVTSYNLTVTAHNDCGYADATATMNLRQIATAQIAWVGCGDKGAGPANAIPTSQGTDHVLYQYLEDYFDLVPVNAYWTIDEAQIKDYYSQFDLVLLTDYPDTNVKPDGVSGGKEKSYSNALGCLIDQIPILTFEAFVADCPNWGINSNPKTPSPKQKDITLLCAAHNIFEYTTPIDEKIEFLTTTSGAGNALQGFSGLEAPSGTIFIATIDDTEEGTLVVCCERQQVIEARMMIFGLNHDAMGKVSTDGKKIIKQIIDYLLQFKNIADCALVFDDANNTHVWSDPGNWAPAHNAVPKPFQAVRVEKDCNVDVENAHCSSIRLMKGTVGTETYDAHLTILPQGALTVTDFIKEVHDANFMTTYPISSSDLIIKADETGRNGTLAFGNEEDALAATVEYYSLGDGAFTSNPIWQYMGIPITDRPTAINQYYAAWMCSWESVGNVSSNWVWVENEDRIVPFKGYCITQEKKKKYEHIGTLNAPETKNLPLAYFESVDGNGFNMFANSWVAPIDITKMTTADFNGSAEATIFIYNTGSRAQYDGHYPNPDDDIETDGMNIAAGQFNAIPVAAASYLSGSLTKIPTMQGFFVQATKAGTLTLDYNRICFNASTFTNTAERMRAPQRVLNEDDFNAEIEEEIVPEVMRIDVNTAQWGDRVYILAHPAFSEAFIRGWDGSKQEGDEAAPMLAVVKEAGKMAVAAIETTNERYLSFRAGKDIEYTFQFEYEGETIYLYDIETAEATEIKTGNTYTFIAANRTPEQRFLITKNPPRTPTDIENVSAERLRQVPEKLIYDGKLFIIHHGVLYDALGKRVELGKEGEQ